MRTGTTRRFFHLPAFAGVMALVALGAFAWARTEYEPPGALDAVRAHLARPLPVHGSDPTAAAGYEARRARCIKPGIFNPYQTQGNRVRRFLMGRELGGNQVDVDFSDCSIRFYLRRQGSGPWVVYKEHPHAG